MTDPVIVSTFEVQKDDRGDTRVVTEPCEGSLKDGEVLLKVDRLALTSNNISYAVTGDSLGYWRFFPAADGWGRIPAMGWSDVVASSHPEIAAGERVWGFFPMSTHLKILAGNAGAAKFRDVSPHRDDLAPVYAQFDRATSIPFYDPSREDQDSLLRGLFATAWLVEDFLASRDSFAADTCLVTSASSKTAIGLAYSLRQRGERDSIGITSQRNVAFCESLGCYDEVVTYDDVQNLDASRAVVIVDMAGSAKVLSGMHHHFGDNVKHSCRVGATHASDMAPVNNLPGARPEFFFAPTHIRERSAEVGPEEFMTRLGTAYTGFRLFCDGWLTIERHRGAEAVNAVYQDVLAGSADPSVGHIISMSPAGRD